jgi:hypothetical protein
MIMKTIVMLFASILIALASAGSQAQNYYVCDAGDDNNDGKSEATPFRSYEKAMDTFNSMSGGDAVLFCRGGVFPTSTDKRLYNSSCGADKVCTMGDYGDPALERPMIVTNNVTALNFNNGGGSSVQDGGYTIKNLILRSATEGAKNGVMLYNDVDDVSLINLHIEGYLIGVHSSGANDPVSGSNQAHDRIVLRDSTIMNNAMDGWLGGCNDCLIENNYFENNGYSGPSSHHTIYISSQMKRQDFVNSGITVRGNTISNVNGACSGTIIVVHGLIDKLTIQDNLIKEEAGTANGSCWGISLSPGNALDEAFTNILISNNTLRNLGGNAIGCASCDGVVIENNYIVDEGQTTKSAINVPHRPEDSVKSQNVVIRNNTVIVSKDDATGISMGGSHVFSASGNKINLPETTTKECFVKIGANELTNTLDNICQLYNELSFPSDETGTIEDVTYESDTETADSGSTTDTETVETADSGSTTDTETVETVDSGSTTDTDSTTDTSSTNTNGKKLGKIKNGDDTVTEEEDVAMVEETDLSTVDHKSCRASANGKCLML